jgi:hypothetical protein
MDQYVDTIEDRQVDPLLEAGALDASLGRRESRPAA